VISPVPSVNRDRRSPIERFKDRGRCSGDESELLLRSIVGDLDPDATGVVSPSVDVSAASGSTRSISVEKESQLPVSPDQLDRRSWPTETASGDNVACGPPKEFIGSSSVAKMSGAGCTGTVVTADCSFGGDCGKEGAQYLDRERCV